MAVGERSFLSAHRKRLPQKVSEIVIQFRAQPFSIFPADAAEWEPNRLIIRLQPEEGMRPEMMAKDPGPGGFACRPQAWIFVSRRRSASAFPMPMVAC